MIVQASFLTSSLTMLIFIVLMSNPQASLFIDAFSIRALHHQQQQRRQQQQQHPHIIQKQQLCVMESPTTTTLHVFPIDAASVSAASETTATSLNTLHDTAQNLWIATIDSDIANIQLEEFRKVFAGGISVMVGGLVSTIAVGAILEKNNLYTKLAAESYLDMAKDDPEFWKKMTAGLEGEEKIKAEELMEKIKRQQSKNGSHDENIQNGITSVAVGKNNTDKEVPSSSQGENETQSEKESAKASTDIFSDY